MNNRTQSRAPQFLCATDSSKWTHLVGDCICSAGFTNTTNKCTGILFVVEQICYKQILNIIIYNNVLITISYVYPVMNINEFINLLYKTSILLIYIYIVIIQNIV